MHSTISPQVETFIKIAEAKRIFAALEASLLRSSPSTVLVSSSSPGEGKSLVTAGLSSIAAGHGTKRVLAMDLNWYAPSLHTYFGMEQEFGIERLQSERSGISLAKPTSIPNLHVLTAPEAPDTDEGWDGDEFVVGTEVLKQARQAYDLVFADTSSVFPTNRRMMDPVTLSTAADGIVLVVLANVTPRQTIKRACSILEASGANILGVIVNQWKNPL